MSFLSTRRRTGTLLFAALVNPANGQFWRVTGGAGAWATFNPATSLPAEFVFAFAESPAGSGRLAIAAPPTGFTNLASVPAGMSVSVWLITVASGVPTNAQIVAGGLSHLRRWDTVTQRLVDPAEYMAEQARLQVIESATLPVVLPEIAPSGYGPAAVAAADTDFEFTPVGATVLPVVSVEYLKVAVVATIAGRRVDATAYAVEFAFVTDTADLPDATWNDAEWDDAGRARLLVGPDQVELAAGAYHWYVRVAADPERTIRRLPTVLRIEP